MIYDIANQVTQIVDRRDGTTPNSILQTAMVLLKNFLERRGMPTTESSLAAAIQDLLMNLQEMPNQLMNPGGMNFGMGGPNNEGNN